MLHEIRKARSGGWSTLGAVPNRTQKFIAINEDTSFAPADHDIRCHRKRCGDVEESCVMGLCDFRRAVNRDQLLGNTRADGFADFPPGRFVVPFRSIARGRCRSSHTQGAAPRTWGNARCGNPCDEIHPPECRSPGSFLHLPAFFANTIYRSEETPSLRNRSQGVADAHRYRRECLELADPNLAFCESVSGSAHSATRAIGWRTTVLARCATTAARVRKRWRVNTGSTTAKARRQGKTSRNSRLLLNRMIPHSRLAKEKMYLVLVSSGRNSECSLEFLRNWGRKIRSGADGVRRRNTRRRASGAIPSCAYGC
jgi:hypothetical protein